METFVSNLNSGARKKGRPKTSLSLKKKIEKYCDSNPNLQFLKKKQRPCNHAVKNISV